MPGTMKQILYCDWLHKWAERGFLAFLGFPTEKMQIKKIIVDHACFFLKWTKFLSLLFFLSFGTLTVSLSINMLKQNLAKLYPAISADLTLGL